MDSPFSSSSWALSLLPWRTWMEGWWGMSPFPCITSPVPPADPITSGRGDNWELPWLASLWWWWWWWWWWCFFLFFMMIFRLRSDGGGRSVPGSNWKKGSQFIWCLIEELGHPLQLHHRWFQDWQCWDRLFHKCNVIKMARAVPDNLFWPRKDKFIPMRNLQTLQAMYIQHNAEVCLCNHCCNRKAISITYSESMFVVLASQHEICMPHTLICGLSCSTTFLRIISKWYDFQKELLNKNVCSDFLCNFCLK